MDSKIKDRQIVRQIVREMQTDSLKEKVISGTQEDLIYFEYANKYKYKNMRNSNTIIWLDRQIGIRNCTNQYIYFFSKVEAAVNTESPGQGAPVDGEYII